MVIVVIFSWIIAGVIVGFLASKFVNSGGDAPGLGIAVAAGASLLTGILATWFGGTTPTEFNLRTVLIAAAVAAVASIVWHLVRSRFVSHEAYTTRRSY
jgi:uncharacterized membrane protein YeaQ/YmgE (transglycosylase-associated protein family)